MLHQFKWVVPEKVTSLPAAQFAEWIQTLVACAHPERGFEWCHPADEYNSKKLGSLKEEVNKLMVKASARTIRQVTPAVTLLHGNSEGLRLSVSIGCDCLKTNLVEAKMFCSVQDAFDIVGTVSLALEGVMFWEEEPVIVHVARALGGDSLQREARRASEFAPSWDDANVFKGRRITLCADGRSIDVAIQASEAHEIHEINAMLGDINHVNKRAAPTIRVQQTAKPPSQKGALLPA